MQELTAIHALAHNNSHNIETETYVGWLTEDQAIAINGQSDRLLLHA